MKQKFPKRLFNKMLRLSHEYAAIKSLFDRKIDEIFGIHYSDVDDDWLIDALDYGTSDIDYDTFVEHMKSHQEENPREDE